MPINEDVETMKRAEARPYTFKLLERQRDSMKRISLVTGTAIAEQIRRGVDLWIAQQESGQ